jgi:hypothetical protein
LLLCFFLLKLQYQIKVSVQGPYGVGVDFSRFDAVLFVGGGIGVTPLHAAFRSLVHVHGESSAAERTGTIEVPASVRLVWACRTPALLDLFADTWQSAAPVQHAASAADKKGPVPGFSFAAWCSAPDGAERGQAQGPASADAEAAGAAAAGTTAAGPYAAAQAKVPWAVGRPDLRAEVSALAAAGQRALVVVCHVPAAVAEVAALAQEFGVELHAETFEL